MRRAAASAQESVALAAPVAAASWRGLLRLALVGIVTSEAPVQADTAAETLQLDIVRLHGVCGPGPAWATRVIGSSSPCAGLVLPPDHAQRTPANGVLMQRFAPPVPADSLHDVPWPARHNV